MPIKIEAVSRLLSMAIKQGDNYSQGLQKARKIITRGADDLTLIAYQENIALLRYKEKYDTSYYLALLSKPADLVKKRLPKWEDSLKAAGIKQIIGTITVAYDGETSRSWVDDSFRGKGYGKGLYITAFRYSRKGIKSSLDLGTFSLATWISLYKTYSKIKIHLGKTPLSRDDVVIEGLQIIYEGKDLTSSDAPNFTFVWPK
jgi:hypothetical protein